MNASECIRFGKMTRPNLKEYVKHVWLTALGLFIILFPLPIYLVVCVPLIIYRLLVVKVIAPWKRSHGDGDLGKPITAIGVGMAMEFVPSDKKLPELPQGSTRWGIVTCLVFEGKIDLEEVKSQIWKKWITQKDPRTGMLKYPEFQMFIEEWLGFMFWRKDKSFNLDYHVHLHRNSDSDSSGMRDDFVNGLVEKLLADRFPPERSPWELHVVQNYRNEELLHQSVGEMTVLILKNHHAMADGFSIMRALVEDLFEIPPETFTFATPRINEKPRGFIRNLIGSCAFPLKLCHDVGYVVSKTSMQPKTPFHFPDGKVKTRQLFGKSKLIPVGIIKETKDNFGVSFTSVIISSIGTALAKILKMKGSCEPGQIEKLIFGTVLPLSSHPEKMRNHVTGTALELCVKGDISNEKRLFQTEADLEKAKHSAIPVLLPVVAKMTSFHVAPVMKHLAKNKVLSAGLSNFPGPLMEQSWGGRRMLGGYFACGTGVGTQGMVFSVLSYSGNIRIILTTEEEILRREEVTILLDTVREEIFRLHEASFKFRAKNRSAEFFV